MANRRAPWAEAMGAAAGASAALGLADTFVLLSLGEHAGIAFACGIASAGLALAIAALLAGALAPVAARVRLPKTREELGPRLAAEIVRFAVALAAIATSTVLARQSIRTTSLLAISIAVAAAIAIPIAGLAADLARAIVDRIGKGRARRLATPKGILAMAAALGIAALAAFAALFPDEAEAIGTRPVLVSAFAAALAVFGALGARRLGSRARRIGAAAIVLVVATPLALLPRAPSVRAALALEATVAPHALDLWSFALDVDRDGYLSILGGGDCAPFDAARSPGALDLPDDGVDQDCDGKDLTARELAGRAGHSRPVPPAFVKKRPVLLVTADALRPDHLGAWGYRRRTSPAIDRFARGALRFEHAYAHGPSTRFSIPTLLTSRYTAQIRQAEHGPLPRPLDPANRMLAEILRDEGYRTVAVPGDRYFSIWRGLRDGFEVFDTTATTPDADGRTSAKVADVAIARLRQSDPRPVFLWAHFYDTHSPYRPGPGGPDFGGAPVDRYDAEIAQQDREIGRLLAAAERILGPADPLVVFAADHGEAFGEHGRATHGFDLFEETTRVPLIVSLRGGKVGVSPELAGLADVVPTIADLVGVRDRAGFEGRSLAAHVVGAPPDPTARVFGELSIGDFDPRNLASVHAGRRHLVVDYTLGVSRVYDFVADPAESRPLPEHTPDVRALRRELDLWRRRVVLGGQEAALARAMSDRAPRPANPIQARLGDVLDVAGWDVVPGEPRRGDQGFEIVLYAKVLRRPAEPLTVLVDLVSERGATLDADHVAAGGFLPSRDWRAGAWLEDRVFVYVRRTEPAGVWKLRMGLGPDRERPLPATGPGAADGWVPLGEVEVR